jgi:hypothetical protein
LYESLSRTDFGVVVVVVVVVVVECAIDHPILWFDCSSTRPKRLAMRPKGKHAVVVVVVVVVVVAGAGLEVVVVVVVA